MSMRDKVQSSIGTIMDAVTVPVERAIKLLETGDPDAIETAKQYLEDLLEELG